MRRDDDRDACKRVEQFLDDKIAPILGNARKRDSFAMYFQGLLSDAERKSMEPIAARACGDPRRAGAFHERLQYLISESRWDDHAVRRAAARHGVDAMLIHGPIRSWIVDDTGLLKQGKHSVGVQRQYTGTAGKVTNCQVAVTLCVANDHDQLSVDTELYLPRSWTDDVERREAARIPETQLFETKPQLALTMIHRALRDGVPPGVVLADAAYGTSSDFRASVRELQLHYAVAVDRTTKVWRLDRLRRRRAEPLSVADLASGLHFRRLTWREGTKGPMRSRFAFTRVVPYHDDGIHPSVREDVWLIVEWPDGEEGPTKFNFCSLPAASKRKALIRILKDRWRIERCYEDLKGELGFDHFEGRSFPGWHHHMSVVHSCAALLVSERARLFPPCRAAVASAPETPSQAAPSTDTLVLAA